MIRYALVLAGIVRNKITSEQPIGPVAGYDATIDITSQRNVEIGDSWDGAKFVAAPPDPAGVNRQTIETQLAQDFANIDAYIALPAPSAAQRLAYERLVGRYIKRLWRLQAGLLDGTN